MSFNVFSFIGKLVVSVLLYLSTEFLKVSEILNFFKLKKYNFNLLFFEIGFFIIFNVLNLVIFFYWIEKDIDHAVPNIEEKIA